jgi:hypothetical protein
MVDVEILRAKASGSKFSILVVSVALVISLVIISATSEYGNQHKPGASSLEVCPQP